MSESAPPTSLGPDPWAAGTYEGAELATLRQGAKLSLAEKLAWLEAMQKLSLQFQMNRRARGEGTIFPDGRIED